MSANTWTLLLAPFDKFLVPYWGYFFSFLCIWDVAHLNCHPLLPIFNHFYPFSIPHIELSSLAINKCVASTLRITTALPFTIFAVPITQETTDNTFPVLRVKGHLIAASKSEATGTQTLKASGRDGVCCQLCGHRPGDIFECGTCHLNMCASCMPLHSCTLQG